MRRLAALSLAFVTLAALAASAGCAKKEVALAPPKPAEVIVSPAAVRTVTDFEDFTGRTEPVLAVGIRSRVSGYLDEIYFKEGGTVKAGDLLFQIDPRNFQAELDSAVAKVEQANARVKRLNADFERAAGLRNRGAISQEDYDKIAADRTEALAAVAVVEADRRRAELNLSYTKIRAPFGGVISKTSIDPGNLVEAEKTLLTGMATSDPMRATFDVDERTLLRVRRLMAEGKMPDVTLGNYPVYLALADEEQFTRAGKVDFVDTHIDAGTGTLRVRAEFQNPKNELLPGLFVRVRVPIGLPHKAVVVPELALRSDQGQKFVFIVNDANEVENRKVKVGQLDRSLRVIEEGVRAGEKVIVYGSQRVRPKAKVDPKVEEIPAASEPAATPPVAQATLLAPAARAKD